MLAIIRENGGEEGAPSAEQVAERAQVGLRSVFRHFKDMDSLYGEMAGAVEVGLMAEAEKPFRAADWRGRVAEMVARRGVVFERIAPFRRAAETVRHRSPTLEADSRRLAAVLRALLLKELPAEVAARPEILGALDLLLSWEAWSRLRREQGLSVAETEAVLEGAVRRLLA